jgi:cytochrome c biogenesis protein ResB
MGGSSDTKWIQKFSPWSATFGDTRYELVYGDKTVPLGFTLKLDRFEEGYYPGTSRPRSFESHVTITDPVTGRRQSRVISMNNPTDYGGYSMFQSSRKPVGQRMMSVLSVARDPGQMIVFTGYIGAMAGMLIVLGTRIADRRRMARDPAAGNPLDTGGASRVEVSSVSADATAGHREDPHAGALREDEQQQESGKREHP